MNYEEKYKEALDRAKGLLEGMKEGNYNALEDDIIDIFPELKECEDEKIRKEILNVFNQLDEGTTICGRNYDYAKWIAWLEKQGEQKLTLPKWEYKKDNTPLLRDSLILNKYGCVAKSPSGAIVSDVWVLDYDELAKLPKEELEKQGEDILIEEIKRRKELYSQEKEKAVSSTEKLSLGGRIAMLEELCAFIDVKQGEQKSTNKVEPKFKVGDKV